MKESKPIKTNPLIERLQHLRRVALVLDTETTGSNRQNDKVVERGVVRASDGKVLIDARFEPSKKVEPWAYKVHRISDRDLKGKPRFAARWNEYAELLSGAVIVGWNVVFDRQMIEGTCAKYGRQMPDVEWVDLMPLYRQLKQLSKNCKLFEACDQMKVKAGDHNAVNDALATARVLFAAANTEPEIQPEAQTALFEDEDAHKWELPEVESWYAEDADEESEELPEVKPVAVAENREYVAPHLTEGGDLVIGFQSHPKFHHWAGGQTLWQTLADLSANAATVRRYALKVDVPHCKDELVELDGVRLCVACGHYLEAENDKHLELVKELGF